jgi:CheY-like chemotaxis protein
MWEQKALLLLVEDEALLAVPLEAELEDEGFKVVLALSGSEALEHLEKSADQFAGIVTDIRLGSTIDGWEVARIGRRKNPHLAVVYMSGDSAADWPIYGVPNSIMLSKPFALAQLITAIATLNEAQGGIG